MGVSLTDIKFMVELISNIVFGSIGSLSSMIFNNDINDFLRQMSLYNISGFTS